MQIYEPRAPFPSLISADTDKFTTLILLHIYIQINVLIIFTEIHISNIYIVILNAGSFK